jgi:hypothetical protein
MGGPSILAEGPRIVAVLKVSTFPAIRHVKEHIQADPIGSFLVMAVLDAAISRSRGQVRG